jgi:PAS domain-containing protein
VPDGPKDLRVRVIRAVRALVLWAAGYALAAMLGRLTVLPDSGVSMVWPAAGVSVLWIIARARGGRLATDLLLIGVLTSVVIFATGGSTSATVTGGVAAMVQVVVCGAIIARWCPGVWGGRGRRTLNRTELWWFFIAAVAGPLASAPLVGINTVLSGAGWDWEVILLWWARNTGSIVLIVPLGLVIGALVRRRMRRPSDASGASGLRSRPAEWAAILILSPLLHAAWFLLFSDLTVVFPLLTLACWAGVRLPAALVTVHSALVGAVVIGVTAGGVGPFLSFGDPTTAIAVAQLYVGLVCVIGLALALDRDDRAKLSAALAQARDAAQAQADLYGTIVDTMGEGVRVVDRDGRVLVRNHAASRLLLGEQSAAGGRIVDGEPDDELDLRGIRNLDGSALAPEDLPFRRSLAGQDVRDLDLLVRPRADMGASDERIVSFTAARLPATAGGGVVTVLRDVTLERQELHRAAQVQASLLPTEVPQLPGYEIAARFVPAGSVGGDFYDWHGVDDGVVLTLADVMGKGPGAAILAATTRSLLRAHGGDADVVRPLVATERGMGRDLENINAFVTVFRAHVHAPTGTVTYSDAGHGLSAIATPGGEVRRLRANGFPLGVAPDEPRWSETERISLGDVLIVVSDGVLDALGGDAEHLEPVWKAAARASSAAAAVEAIVALVSGQELEDDVTVLALRRQPGPAGS